MWKGVEMTTKQRSASSTTANDGNTWGPLRRSSRRLALTYACQGASVHVLRDLLEHGETDAVGRSVLREAIEERERVGCD